MKTSAETKEIFSALWKAQGLIAGAPKNSRNPHFNSKFADLESCVETIREPFAKNGLSISQSPTMINSEMALEAIIMHSSGQWIQFDPFIVPIERKSNPQSAKSGLTYMRRAQLLAICGVAEVDDDGNQAAEPEQKTTAPAAKRATTSAPPKEAQADQSQPPLCCGKKMMTSKFEPAMWYCPNCKTKQNKALPPDDEIPF